MGIAPLHQMDDAPVPASPHNRSVIIADLNCIGRYHGGRAIFRGLSWSLQDGEKVGLIGPSGCGKSTLLRVLAGADKAEEGAITFRRGAKVAYLEQEFTGQPGRRAIDEVLTGHDALSEVDDAIVAV